MFSDLADFSIAYIACHVLKLPHKIEVPAGMISSSNFFELAVAVAIVLFGTNSLAPFMNSF